MNTPAPGTLYLIPVPLAANALHTLPPQAISVIHAIRYFVVENARTTRRVIKLTNPTIPINELIIREINKHNPEDPADLLSPLLEGFDVGIMTEAGCPGVADPGSDLVRFAHEHAVRVVPVAGPSSIIMALMASGLGGQKFTFHGYLAPKRDILARDLRKLEQQSWKDGATQVFIETPYRNMQVMEAAMTVLNEMTTFCIAADLTAETEWIRTMTIAGWKKSTLPDLHKRPVVFCLRANGAR